MNILLVFAGGGFGAVLRFIFQLYLGKHVGSGFPMATFTVNILGCLLIGVLAGLAFKLKWNEQALLFFVTGILGGFTTYSSYALEFVQLLKNNQAGMAFLYLGLSNFVGLALCALGFYLFK